MFQIAVCDDEKIFVERISEIVKAFFKEQKLECQVDEFYSGEEFVELKEEVGKYDIVFLDMQMDKMNGIETAKYLRKYGEDTFLVFVTAYAEYAATGYQVQATWFVIKDYDKDGSRPARGFEKYSPKDSERSQSDRIQIFQCRRCRNSCK